MPKVSVVMCSYNRPLFLQEAVCSLFKSPGTTDFEFILWDNNSNEETKKLSLELAKKFNFQLILNSHNIGHDALRCLLEKVKGEYFVLTEDDMTWFQDNWLADLVKGFEQKPNITEAGKELGYKDEWGILATNVLIDPVNNAGMWKERLRGMIEYKVGDVVYWANVRAGGGALIFRTELLRKLHAFPDASTTLNGAMAFTNHMYEQEKYPTGHIRDTYIYHACSPFWNKLYREVWNTKQKGTISIEEALKQYKEKGNFDWDNEWLLDVFKNGIFSKYAEELCKVHLNNRG